MECPKCKGRMVERTYFKKSSQLKKGKKVYKGQEVKKYVKTYVYDCLMCGGKALKWEYVDVPE